MINWPEDLITDIARRRAVLFVGAGISMNSVGNDNVRPKSWVDLITHGAKLLDARKRRIVTRLLKERDYLTACEILKGALGKDEYESFLTRETLNKAEP